jgi:hypothetical protein
MYVMFAYVFLFFYGFPLKGMIPRYHCHRGVNDTAESASTVSLRLSFTKMSKSDPGFAMDTVGSDPAVSMTPQNLILRYH